MKVLIVSDTHGREQNLAEALEQTGACRDHCRK